MKVVADSSAATIDTLGVMSNSQKLKRSGTDIVGYEAAPGSARVVSAGAAAAIVGGGMTKMASTNVTITVERATQRGAGQVNETGCTREDLS